MSNISLESIERFTERTRVASRTKLKEVRLTIQEAEDIALAISQLMVRNASLLEDLVASQRETIEVQKSNLQATTIEVDSGTF